MKLHNYQHTIAHHIIDNPRCAIWASMGMGKSLATLFAVDMLDLIENVYPVLVIAPLRVAKYTWPSEVAKWPVTQHMQCQFIGGTPANRKKTWANLANINTINFELLPNLVKHFGDDWPFRTVVVDESTRLKSFRITQGSARARALSKVAHTKVKRFVQLTGTPSPQGLTDLWGQIWFLDRGFRLGQSFTGFEKRWFRSEQIGPNAHARKLHALPHAQQEIQEKLQDICLTIEAKDYLDINEPVVNHVEVVLPPKAREIYDDMEQRFFAELEDEGVEAANAAAKSMKCLQIANGALYVNEGSTEWEEIHDAKIQALDSVIEEANGTPVLVAYKFKSDLARLLKAFPQAVAMDKRGETIEAWNAGEIPLMLLHPQSAGHGLSLQHGGNILVFFSLDWSLENWLQVIERIGPARQKQSGYDRPVFVHHLIAADTVDELVLQRLTSKRSVQDILMDAMKRRTT